LGLGPKKNTLPPKIHFFGDLALRHIKLNRQSMPSVRAVVTFRVGTGD